MKTRYYVEVDYWNSTHPGDLDQIILTTIYEVKDFQSYVIVGGLIDKVGAMVDPYCIRQTWIEEEYEEN